MTDMTELSLGLIETRGLIGAIEAADAAAKSASVVVSSAELSQNGNTTITIVGELSSVQAAVEAAIHSVERVGRLISSKVIPRPDQDLWKIIGRQKFIPAYGNANSGPALQWNERPAQPSVRKPPVKQKIVTIPASRTIAAIAPRKSKGSKLPSVAEKEPVTATPSPSGPKTISLTELENLAVVKLRQYARTLADLPLKGRQISMANKSQLLEAISSARKQ